MMVGQKQICARLEHADNNRGIFGPAAGTCAVLSSRTDGFGLFSGNGDDIHAT